MVAGVRSQFKYLTSGFDITNPDNYHDNDLARSSLTNEKRNQHVQKTKQLRKTPVPALEL